MRMWPLLCLFLLQVAGQGTPPTDTSENPTRNEFELLKKQIVLLDTKLKELEQLEWLKTESYCIFKKGKCPPGFEEVALKTWIQRGASGRMDNPTTTQHDPFTWITQKSPTITIHLEKENLGNIGDSYIKQKCIKGYDGRDTCFADIAAYVNNENEVKAKHIDGLQYRSMRLIASNELVLNACCK